MIIHADAPGMHPKMHVLDTIIEQAIPTAIVGTLVALLLAALTRGGQRAAGVDARTGGHILRHGRAYRWLGIVCVALFTLPMLLLPSAPPAIPKHILLLFFSPFSLSGLWMINDSRARVVLSEAGIEAFSPWRGRAWIPWHHVTHIHFGRVTQWFVICGLGGQRIRIHHYMHGSSEFLPYCRRHLPPEMILSAEVAYFRIVGGLNGPGQP